MRIEPWGSTLRIEPHPGRLLLGLLAAPFAAVMAVAFPLALGPGGLPGLLLLATIVATPLAVFITPVGFALCMVLIPRVAPRLSYACALGGLFGLVPALLMLLPNGAAQEPRPALCTGLFLFVAPGVLGGAVFWSIVVFGARSTDDWPDASSRASGRRRRDDL